MEPHIQMENEVKRKATQRLRESSPEFLQLGDKDDQRWDDPADPIHENYLLSQSELTD